MKHTAVAPIPQQPRNSMFNGNALREWATVWATIACAELLSILNHGERLSAEVLPAR